MPVERPTVPNALVTSNRLCISVTWGSMTSIRNVPTITTDSASSVMTAALRKVPTGSA